MLKKLLSSKKFVYLSMSAVVFIWGFEYIAAKAALDMFRPFSLICMKYALGFSLVLILKLIIDKRLAFRRRDIPVLVICALFGEVLYYGAEYGAMAYLPISVITIVLAFVPCVSVIIELLLYKSKPTGLIILGVLVSVAGVAMVIGADVSEIFQGKYLGYLLVVSAVLSWNIYNFTTRSLTERYNPLDLTLLQAGCSALLVLPYTVLHWPDMGQVNLPVIAGVCYLGAVSAFLGFLIYIHAIDVIGPTPCALFFNFLPVTSTFFGWLILHEQVSALQIVGGAVVIASGSMVIWQKGKEEETVQIRGASKN